MGLSLDYKDGQSELTEEEKEGLKIKTVTNHEELNEFEQENINKAQIWLLGKKITLNYLLSEKFIKNLHKKMFGRVWLWAGTFRRSNKNIGKVDWSQIPIEIKKLIDDCHYWVKHKTFSDEEIAARLSHRLVWIHPFPNGNGRHSRLMADLMMERIFDKSHFSWSGKDLRTDNEMRNEYLAALHEADDGSFDRLISFVK